MWLSHSYVEPNKTHNASIVITTKKKKLYCTEKSFIRSRNILTITNSSKFVKWHISQIVRRTGPVGQMVKSKRSCLMEVRSWMTYSHHFPNKQTWLPYEDYDIHNTSMNYSSSDNRVSLSSVFHDSSVTTSTTPHCVPCQHCIPYRHCVVPCLHWITCLHSIPCLHCTPLPQPHTALHRISYLHHAPFRHCVQRPQHSHCPVTSSTFFLGDWFSFTWAGARIIIAWRIVAVTMKLDELLQL